MTSLLRMSEQELATHEGGLALKPALGIAAGSSVLALAGMMLRFSPGDDVPISGMDHFAGQTVIAAGLGASMLAAAYLVRSVFMKRLQWAVLLSLLIHLCVCFALRTVVVDVPLTPFAEVGAEEIPMRDFTLPDYGGMESESQPQEWERPSDVDPTEAEQHELERQTAEVTPDAQPEDVEVERQVDSAAVPDRQQQPDEEMQQALEMEIQRQQQNVESDAPEMVEAPEVQTAEVREPNLEAREMERQQSNPQNSQRQMQEVQSQIDPRVTSAKIAARSQTRPTEIMELPSQQTQRTAAEVEAAETSAEAVEMAQVAEVSNAVAEARTTNTARQSDSALNDRQMSATSASSNNQMQVQSVSPSRAASATNMAVSAPSSGGAAALQRSASSAGQNTSAASTSAQSVEVASTTGAGTPNLTAATSSSNVARGSSSIPTGSAGGGGAPSMRLSNAGVSALQSGTVGRGRGSQTGPQLGSSVASDSVGGSGPRGSATGQPGAVGTRAQEVAVAGVSGGSGSSNSVLATGPSSNASGVGRSGSGLPAGSNSNLGMTAPSLGGGSGNRTVAMNAVGRSGLSGRGTDNGARLRGNIVGGGGGLPTGRSTRGMAGISLPSGALEAEQSGALVIAGPQAPGGGSGRSGNGNGPSGSGGGSLSGPRIASTPRASAGLPGSGRGASTSIGRSRPSLSGGITASRITGRPGSGGSRPSLASSSEVASLIRRNVPGISDIQTDRISAAFSMRTPEARREAVEELGGTEQSEAAVERGLEWLAAHQYAAGNWSIHSMHCTDHDCEAHGTYDADPAATGLALLAFLGAGNTHKSGQYQSEVRRGIDWLLSNQKSNGDLFGAQAEFARFYSHGIAAIALCEAYGMTKDPDLRGPAQNALGYIVDSQHPNFGGWRYQPKFESDTSVSGWQLMALKSGQMAGLTIPQSAYAGVEKWLGKVESSENPGRFSYHPTKEVTETMTAEGLLMRQYLGADRNDSALLAGASFLRQRLPKENARNVYYWYYATQVMFHLQGDHWSEWNASLRDMLVDSQKKGGHTRGSWDPRSPSKDTWGQSGGRHYVTCLNLLMLEVYYRHLPLYIEL